MPNYNHAPYLKERMDSILAQDYSNLEVILLDDASTDESVEVLKAYTDHPKVKVLITNPANSGNTFVQWQHGLELATGAYVWVAESDDIAEPTFLTQLVAALEREKAVLAFCNSQWIDSQGHPMHHRQDPMWQKDFAMEGEVFAHQYLLGYNTICNASAVVFRRDAAMHVDMQQITQFSASGDRLFWIEMALQGRVAYVGQKLNKFRQHTQKVSSSAEWHGLNIMQDHAIYEMMASRLHLTEAERYIICGYHWKAIHRPTVSPEGRQQALAVWAKEPAFGRMSFLMYLLRRAKERC